MPFTQVDPTFLQGEHLNFQDQGYLKIGAKTRKYAVMSRHDSSLVGYVKWYNHWRQYVFFPLNSLFDKKCMRELADFCEKVTTEHREQ